MPASDQLREDGLLFFQIYKCSKPGRDLYLMAKHINNKTETFPYALDADDLQTANFVFMGSSDAIIDDYHAALNEITDDYELKFVINAYFVMTAYFNAMSYVCWHHKNNEPWLKERTDAEGEYYSMLIRYASELEIPLGRILVTEHRSNVFEITLTSPNRQGL